MTNMLANTPDVELVATNTETTKPANGAQNEKNLSMLDQEGEDGKLGGIRLLALGVSLCFMILLITLNASIVSTIWTLFLRLV